MSAAELEQRKKGKLRMIGVIGIVREQEIGYRIHPDFWGKGFMSEALNMFIEMFWGMESMPPAPSTLIDVGIDSGRSQ